MRASFLAAIALVVGCPADLRPGADPSDSGADSGDTAAGCEVAWFRDADGDGHGSPADAVTACTAPSGYVPSDGDCDDHDPALSPDTPETCNGVDDDCDGDVDPADSLGAVRWYADSDGDGVGDPLTVRTACAAPAGFVAEATDCDDEAAAVHPGAAERCNGLDDDCDGLTDPATAEDAPTWYADTDGDGHGDAAGATQACSAPAAHVAGADDCDDADPTVAPGADDTCGDGRDQDCDGAPDQGCAPTGTRSPADADAGLLGDGAADALGAQLLGDLDLDGDGELDLVVATAWSAGAGSDLYLVPGPFSGTRVLGAAERWEGTASQGYGQVRGLDAGDLDGDGQDDLAFVAYDADVTRVHVALGPTGGGSPPSTALDLEITDYLELAVGDADGDGQHDLIYASSSGAGGVSVDAGPTLGDGERTVLGAVEGGRFGADLDAHVDLDADGVAELVIGSTAGVWIFSGGLGGATTADAADSIYTHADATDEAGASLAALADGNGDGLGDLLVAAAGADGGAGAAYRLDGPHPSGAVLGTAAAQSWTGGSGVGLGRSVAVADVDGDAISDVLLGSDADAALLYFGDPAAVGTVSAACASADACFAGSGEGLGRAVARLGDVDGLGVDAVAIGASGDDTGAADAGAAWLWLGGRR